MSEAVTVTGTPTLTLNDGGTATYTGGSGTNALTFSYTVGARCRALRRCDHRGQPANGATITDASGNAASPHWRRDDVHRSADRSRHGPRSARLRRSPSSGDLNAGKTVT